MNFRKKHALYWLGLILLLSCSTPQPLNRVPQKYLGMVQVALQMAGNNATELQKFLSGCEEDHMEGAAFLLSYMPKPDLEKLTANFLAENVRWAYRAKDLVKWGAKLPDSIFLNYVLPYANIHERRDPWRKVFFEKFYDLVKDISRPGAAAVKLNRSIWQMLHVKYSTKRPKADQSPFETIQAGLASCTGLSILLVDACRSVGIPARLTGVPMWYDDSGNHSWVEVWDNGWHFIESASDDTLDKAWFQEHAARANRSGWQYGIYALSFKKTGHPYHNIFNPNADYFWSIDVTDRYARKVKSEELVNLRVKVVDEISGERVSAKVQLWDGSRMVAEGISRGEQNDVNDILTFKTMLDHNYILNVIYGKQSVKKAIKTNGKREELVIIKIRVE